MSGMIEYDGMMGYDGMTGWMVVWPILGLTFMVAVVVLIVWIARRSSATPMPSGMSGEGQDAGEVLRRRFASGEIDEKEFTRRRAVLEAQ